MGKSSKDNDFRKDKRGQAAKVGQRVKQLRGRERKETKSEGWEKREERVALVFPLPSSRMLQGSDLSSAVTSH